jgi:hypothetical protein
MREVSLPREYVREGELPRVRRVTNTGEEAGQPSATAQSNDQVESVDSQESASSAAAPSRGVQEAQIAHDLSSMLDVGVCFKPYKQYKYVHPAVMRGQLLRQVLASSQRPLA